MNMGKRFIGIDIDRSQIRVAIVHEEKGAMKIVSLAERSCETSDDVPEALESLFGEDRHFGDRLAAALPASEGFVRRLHFPFADTKKIEAALEFELSLQLPIAVETCQCAFQKPMADHQDGFLVTAAAVRAESLRDHLEPFERSAVPLQVLDLWPFAAITGLKKYISDGVLVSLTETEITLALVYGGNLLDYRFLPSSRNLSKEDHLRFILRESDAVQKAAGQSDLPFFLMGSGATPEIIEAFEKEGRKCEILVLDLGTQSAEPAFLPAIALALRAGSRKGAGLNFRHGPFALRSEWAALKKGAIAAAVLLILSVFTLAGSAYLNYAHQARRAEALKLEMTRIFRKTFPETRAIVDIPLQMAGKIKEMKKRSRLIGAGTRRSPLIALREISQHMPKDITVDIREFNFGLDAVRIDGVTTSFDAINRIAKQLEASPLFKEAQITDAKMSIDGSKVNFHLNLTFHEEKDAQ